MADQEPSAAELLALLRDLAKNQVQINETQRLMEETLRKLADNKVSGEQNGHSANSVLGQANHHPACSRPSMPVFPLRTDTLQGGRQTTFEEVQEQLRED